MRLAYVAHTYDLKNGRHCINVPTASLYETDQEKNFVKKKITNLLLDYVTEHKASTGFFPKSDPHKPVLEDYLDDNAPPKEMILASNVTVYYIDGNSVKKYLRNQKIMDRYGCDGNCALCELCEPE